MLLYQLNKFESLLFSHLTRSPPFSAKITEYALHHGSCFMPTWPILQYQKRGCFSNIVPSFAYGMWHEQTSLQYPQNQPKGMCVSVWLVIMKIWQERDIVMFSVNRSRFMQSIVFFWFFALSYRKCVSTRKEWIHRGTTHGIADEFLIFVN